MLLHTVPILLSEIRLGRGRALLDVRVPEIGLTLVGGRDVVTRTPYPNKHWLLVGARGSPPTDGLLIDVGQATRMTVITRWGIDGERVITHEVHVEAVGEPRDVIAANSALWMMGGSDQWTWDDVRTPWMEPVGTIRLDALMREEVGSGPECVRKVEEEMRDGRLSLRREHLEVPSVERERYDWIANAGWSRRMPLRPINHAR